MQLLPETGYRIAPAGFEFLYRCKALHISTEEFNTITTQIMDCTKEQPRSVEEILLHLKTIKKAKTWKVINYLLAEEKIKTDRDGKLGFSAKT